MGNDLDACNEFAPTGIVDEAFYVLLLNPYFCVNMMRLIDKPGQVLSHVPAQRADHADRVRLYCRHYQSIWGGVPPVAFPSGTALWPQLVGLPRRATDESGRGLETEPPAAQRQRRLSQSSM